MDCRIGPRGVASVNCGVVWWFTRGRDERSDSGGSYLLWLCQVRETVFLSRKAAKRGGHCPPTVGDCCVQPSPHNTIQYVWIHRTPHIVHILIAGSHLTQCVPPRARDSLVPGELDTSLRQGDGFKIPCRRSLHAFTPVSITSLFPFLSQRRPRLCPGHLFNLPSSGNTFILHPCPLLHNIESISSRLCVSHSTLLSFSSHLPLSQHPSAPMKTTNPSHMY